MLKWKGFCAIATVGATTSAAVNNNPPRRDFIVLLSKWIEFAAVAVDRISKASGDVPGRPRCRRCFMRNCTRLP
jgi:hypothetical protein